jgi:hypothetical protein
MRDSVVEAYERGGGRRRPLTPEQLAEITRRMEENGRLGEEFVLNYERRTLRRAGRSALADQVQWVSQESVSEGYDIKSYDISGEEKWIEVKATTGSHRVFEMSQNEWNTCCAAGDKYYIYRVSNVRTSPAIEKIRNPQDLETRGGITRSATGWRVTLH